MIGSDGRTIRFQGERGGGDGRLLDQDSVEYLYGHSDGKSTVATTITMKRQK